MRRSLWVLLALAACSGGGEQPPAADAPGGGDAPIAPDAPATFAACGEFGGGGVQVPAHVHGTLTGADVTAPASCATAHAPFGVATAGPDSVLRIDGLVAGTTYVVRLVAQSDLSFYVVTGCGSASGPTSAQCLLFEDAANAGIDEVGTFIATQPSAFVVVDYYASSTPESSAFTLDVYAQACGVGAACTIDAPVCFDGRCVECETSFDCPDPSRSTCNTASHVCAPGISSCTADDLTAPSDNGPAGAPLIALDTTGRGSQNGLICSAPRTEGDYIAFEVASVGETWDLALAWSGSRDLDLEIDDASGTMLGLSFYEHPETIRLDYLAPGRYYARVSEFSSTANPAPVAYAFSALRSLGAGCTSVADCAREYRNQAFRGQCTGGACVAIAGAGAVAEGGACDSQDDCAPGLSCPSFYFVAAADTRETCARSCGTDGDCLPLGADFVCTTYVATNFCVHRCTSDDDCPTALSQQPASGPWYRLACNQSTGRCTP